MCGLRAESLSRAEGRVSYPGLGGRAPVRRPGGAWRAVVGVPVPGIRRRSASVVQAPGAAQARSRPAGWLPASWPRGADAEA